MPKNAKNAILWTLFVTPLAQHGKLDQTDAFSYYVGVGSTQQRLVPELMVNFLLPPHIYLSNNATNRLFHYTTKVSARHQESGEGRIIHYNHWRGFDNNR